jgi:hypothetical protein
MAWFAMIIILLFLGHPGLAVFLAVMVLLSG